MKSLKKILRITTLVLLFIAIILGIADLIYYLYLNYKAQTSSASISATIEDSRQEIEYNYWELELVENNNI
jgi:uncharacterized membrane protein